MTPTPLRRKLQEMLFNQAPLRIAVIDRELDIVEANARFEQAYGKWRGKKCYRVYKNRDERCAECPAVKTFEDGETRISDEQAENGEGGSRHYRVHCFPIRNEGGGIPYVVEMSSDITDRVAMEKEHTFLFENVPCYITVIDRDFRIIKSNAAFDAKFGKEGKKYCYEMYKSVDEPCRNCPSIRAFETGEMHSALQVGVDKDGNVSHYAVTTAPFKHDREGISTVIEISQDVSEVLDLRNKLKKAEQEKLESERLAAVGQTVAGIAHGVKNIIMGLEGGMYVVNSGLRRDDNGLVRKGWDMLENNISRISSIVAEFLSFAKGAEPKISLMDPVRIAQEVVALYRETAMQSGIRLVGRFPEPVAEASMDPEGIHTSLANLVSNAIDACLVSDKKDLEVVLSCVEKNDIIYYTVEDNGCGMDYDVKKKIFTNFFTTKGSGQGTGLGLLVTRKIVAQHGGRISVRTSAGEGSEFALELPRDRLPRAEKSDT
ncbi:MAG: PAS domain-containing protein [Elusimicrobiota bacterium]